MIDLCISVLTWRERERDCVVSKYFSSRDTVNFLESGRSVGDPGRKRWQRECFLINGYLHSDNAIRFHLSFEDIFSKRLAL